MHIEKIAIISKKPNTKSSAIIQIMEHLKIPFDIIHDDKFLEDIKDYSALVVIADKYPDISENAAHLQSLVLGFQQLKKPIFCEYLPLKGLITDKITKKDYTRLVSQEVQSPILSEIDALSLFETHQNPFLITKGVNSESYTELLSFGRVAGVYNAIYGLPSETYLGLGLKDNLIFSTIKISDFDRMEFRLKLRFGQLLMNICHFLCKDWFDIKEHLKIDEISNPFDNRNYMKSIKGISNIEREKMYLQTLIDGLNWFEHADMFPKPLGLGGVYEGFTSAIDHNGKKSYRFDEKLNHKVQRADCTADTAISFFLTSLLPIKGNFTEDLRKKYDDISGNIFNELFDYWQHFNDDKSILRGFFGWSNSPYDINVAYSDDNGRVLLESLLYSYIKKDEDLFRRSYAAVNALRSTVGKNGHRRTRIDLKDYYQKNGRKWFNTHKVRRNRYKSPHYDAWTFASLIYGGFLIDEQNIINLIKKGIDDYMKIFPNVKVEHSVGDDFSKLLIASVMLYQSTKDEKDLKYIHQIIDFFEPYQDKESGAFPEVDPFKKHARTEKTNAKYGTGESALYTDSSDTISDQLYSLGFMAMGLYFAYKTGKCDKAHNMLMKLLDYLCMIQLKTSNPQLNGTWTRGFDYKFGEPYGANGDVGWGAYSIETGWTVGPILTSFAMYLLDFDPFIELETGFRNKIKEIYRIEKDIQSKIDKNWKENTPKPIKHHNSMNLDEIQDVLKGFKKNSLN